ncbi:hypothetical protein [Neobacillus sp. DY30]|uniref:hypothetical protein n=1 Tax=Neobacillus sp. DY30 TaxID=3047871 RepID=UPI0024BF94F3|nr:hypothetical protein [Neobacillus sp. DY30]WHX98605.1 hypothetical protein QNH29_18380 [Neobacillus sp. DY30]
MSVVIGYVSDYFSIIMTDTRITYGKDAEMGWDDNYEKLVSLPNMGWATGVGVYDFINKFNRKLGTMKHTTVPIMEELFEETLEQEKQQHEYLKEHFDSTVITCSWVGMQEDKKMFRVGMLNKECFGNRLVEIVNHHITILYPYDYLDDLSKVENIENRFSMYTEYNGDFMSLLEQLLQIFAEISANSFGVSKICNIGIQVNLDNDFYKIHLKEDIRPLIKAAKDGSILNKFSVVF